MPSILSALEGLVPTSHNCRRQGTHPGIHWTCQAYPHGYTPDRPSAYGLHPLSARTIEQVNLLRESHCLFEPIA